MCQQKTKGRLEEWMHKIDKTVCSLMKNLDLMTNPRHSMLVIIFDLSHTFNALRMAMLVVKVWFGAKKHKK